MSPIWPVLLMFVCFCFPQFLSIMATCRPDLQALLFISQGAECWCSLLAQACRLALPCPTGSEPACCDTWDALLLAGFMQPHRAPVQTPNFVRTTTISFWSMVSLPFSLWGDNNGSLLCCPIEPPCPITLIFTHLRSPTWQDSGFSALFSSANSICMLLSHPRLVLSAVSKMKL